MLSHALAFAASSSCSRSSAGIRLLRDGDGAAATCIAAGNVSFDDWPMLTWSLGWTAPSLPFAPTPKPSFTLATLAITSLAFMLVEVPEPV